MQINEQDYLDLVEDTGNIASVDIESTGLSGDYNSILCISVKPYQEPPYTFSIKQAGNDKKVVREAKEAMEQYKCWVTFYGKMFDIPMINTRLLKWGLDPVEKRHHVDLFFTLKYNVKTSRRSLAHYGRWLGLGEEKQDMSPDDWIQAQADPDGPIMKKMVSRCESDVTLTEDLYVKSRHLIKEIKKG